MTPTARKTVRRLSLGCLAMTLLVTSAAPADAGKKRGRKAEPDIPSARVALDIESVDALAVRVAFRLAYQRVLEIPACGALFADLELDGPTALSSTSYSSSRPGPERALCNSGVLAVARKGGAEIRLCPRLHNLAQQGVAAILIHEALHAAGLGEYPVDPAAPTSREITLTVLEACSLS
jgi:D-serine deaminase-like pyridoxal phosphate-dependent protein